jgi:L-ribulose-5-phosphate 3-epimerase
MPRALYTAVKWSMIKLPKESATVDAMFQVAKDAGFDGLSLTGPGVYDLDEVRRAQDKYGLPIHNINVFDHWNVRLTDPDPAVRDASLKNLIGAIEFAHGVGASTVLSVIGKVTDPVNENVDHVRERSAAQIRKALPTAARLGVQIACENVANGFAYTIAEWKAYLDSFESPWVGAFFDIGNFDRYDGGAAAWIRALGPRVVKIDVKDHDHAAQKNCDLFKGNVDWPAVRAALDEIRYTGWATAEVSGGNTAHLAQVERDMRKVLGI